MRKTRKFSALLLAGTMAFSPLSVMAAKVDGTNANSTAVDNSTSVVNDLTANDIIDANETGSLTIHKYDFTAAQNDGITFNYSNTDHEKGGTASTISGTGIASPIDITSNGKENTQAEDALKEYALKGVEFTYLKVGDIKTLNDSNNNDVNGDIQLVYDIGTELMGHLGLTAGDAVTTVDGKNYFTSQQINEALAAKLAADEVDIKNKLEGFIASGTAMTETDADGMTTKDGLPLGLYLVVETKVPENVISTVNPWFVQIPMTDIDGEAWFYDIECYPKNQTGHPSLDKMVRNAYGTAGYNYDSTVAGGTTPDPRYSAGDTYADGKIVTNDAAAATNYATWLTADDKNGDYKYGSTVTASAGDILDYILVSKLPKVTSSATYLETFEFYDTLSDGLSYNDDAKIAIYENEADARVNDTTKAKAILTADKFTATKDNAPTKGNGNVAINFALTDAGLTDVNTLYNDGAHYLVVYYTATVASDATNVLGDAGNINDVSLVWKRTNDNYFNTLEDESIVYSYALDLTKKFGDGKTTGFEDVKFILYNESEDYYVQATESATKGLYYVTGKCKAKADATVFTPSTEAATAGYLVINGIEADKYKLTETHTSFGYSLGQNQTEITITPASRTITPASVKHMTVATDDTVNAKGEAGVEHPVANSSITLSDGQVLTAEEEGTTDKTNIAIGDLTSGSAVVNGGAADMCAYGAQLLGVTEITASADGTRAAASDHAGVILEIVNHKGFMLPKTGGEGMVLLALVGSACFMIFGYFAIRDSKKRKAC